ncbi:MAG: hypothetical protein MI749_17940 [Desulfovibrionales bacterium]|nr:hypothetical protein [Desulfovibrionales bacterium]
MSASEHSALTLALPVVQPKHVPFPLPDGVRFCSPGVKEAMGELFYVSPDLPFSPAEARGQLHELLQYGLSFKSARDLSGVALSEKSAPKESRSELKEELAAIDAFEQSGKFTAQEKEKERVDAALLRRIAAQKTLLLAWDMEDRVAELAALKNTFSANSASMDAILGITEDDAFEDLPGVERTPTLAGDVETDLGVPWRSVVAAILEFAPAHARFFAVKHELIAWLEEVGRDITPDHVGEEEYGFSLPYTDGWKLYAIQAYALLGHTRVPEGRDDLDRTIEIFAAG